MVTITLTRVLQGVAGIEQSPKLTVSGRADELDTLMKRVTVTVEPLLVEMRAAKETIPDRNQQPETRR